MKNKNLYVAGVIAVLLAFPGVAVAHGFGKAGPGPHKMCHRGDEAKESKLCHGKDKAAFKKMHALHEKLHAILAAKTFDKKAFLSASDQLEQLHAQLAHRHAQMFADKLAKLSPEEREEMVAHFHERMEEGGWKHHGGGEGYDHGNDYSRLNQ